MRLLIVTRESASDRMYGLGKALNAWAKAFEARGHEVAYFSKVECEAVHRRWQSFWQRLFAFRGGVAPALAERWLQGWQAARQAKRVGATHVWLQDPWLIPGFRWGLRVYHWKSFFFDETMLRWGVSEHGLGSFTWAVAQDGLDMSVRNYRRMLALEKRVLAKAHWVWTPSNAAMGALCRDLQMPNRPLSWRAYPYGCPGLAQKAQPKAWQNDESPVILAVGRVAPVKRFDVLVDALAILKNKHGLTATLKIAGDGAVVPLQEQAARLDVSEQLEIGPEPDMLPVYERASIYTSACAVESHGLANREAVAFGCPSVVAAGGAACEVLGLGAWLVTPTPEKLAWAWAQLLTQPDLYAFWAHAAWREAQTWPTWQEVIKDYEAFLQKL
ncbi:glycosyltransferase family 4 protein [Thiomicrospira sp. WB1]|uniref:glycosyltransferase family 4 protein n=1 Tax=Thiomicrospira sp. WB1 TaxID=1685380 RepID=UPI00074879D7|nr:glycosyltransferase [Thiomicrospira sp. WB1]KUJ72465.1 hypothetical protein AVO41_01240 [Thiomicrospira sp. WB1]